MRLTILLVILMAAGTTIAQNVGIGTNTPTYPLTVMASINRGIVQKDGEVEVGFFTTAGNAFLQTWTNHPLFFATNNSNPIMAITTSGNVGIGITAPINKLQVESAVTSSGASIYAYNSGNSGNAVLGVSNLAGTYGVQGTSNFGTGVYGYTNEFRAVAGGTISGTALYGFSSSGFGLETIGKLKISGGNTNPIPGAVLTSIDGSGNAVWKPKKIAFSIYGRHASYTTIPHNTTRKMHFSTVEYDYGGNYNLYNGGTPTTNSSTFQVPVNGLYHFDLKVALQLIESGATDDFTEIIGSLRRIRAGNTIDVAVLDAGCCIEKDWKYFLNGGFDVPLLAGDLIYMEVTQRNDGDLSAEIIIPMSLSGHLVFAD